MHMNKIIFYTIFETIILTITICVTYYMWNSFEIEESAKIAYSYTNKNEKIILTLKNNLTELMPLKDTLALKETNQLIIELHNPSQIKKQYALYLRINNDTTVDRSYLKINTNLETKNISCLENYKKELNLYYLIKTGVIYPSEKIKETAYIWLSEETPDTEQNKILNFDLYLEEI